MKAEIAEAIEVEGELNEADDEPEAEKEPVKEKSTDHPVPTRASTRETWKPDYYGFRVNKSMGRVWGMRNPPMICASTYQLKEKHRLLESALKTL